MVALAYVDQLVRGGALSEERAQAYYAALEQASGLFDRDADDSGVADELAALAGELPEADAAGRVDALRAVLEGVAASLR